MSCLGEGGKLLGITNPQPNIYQSQILQSDPFGSQTGGQQQRKSIFDYLDSQRPGIEQDSAENVAALKNAAANPGYQAAQGYANSLINGDYLHGSPEFENGIASMRAASGRQAGDQAANVRDQYSRAGLKFSTAANQAQQSAGASATAGADAAEAGARAANYANERNLQNGGVDVLNKATSAPLSYLSQLSSARLAPQAQQANIVQSLAGNGSVTPVPQDVAQQSGYLGTLFGNVGKL